MLIIRAAHYKIIQGIEEADAEIEAGDYVPHDEVKKI